MRSNVRPIAAAIDCPSEVLPTPGGPTKQRIERARVRLELAHREELEDAVLHLLDVVVVAVEHLARVLEVEVVLGRLATRAAWRATRGRCGSRRARPTAAAAARSAAAHARPASERARAGPPARSARAARAPRPASRPTSPSSSWIAFSCWRSKYSRWPLSISDWTCDWILGPDLHQLQLASEDLREQSQPLWSRRAPPAAAASPRSSIRSAPAIMCASSEGSSRFATAICSSSGR